MEKAHGAAAVAIKDAVLKEEPATPVERDEYAQRMVKEFEKELTSQNTDARLNTAILMAKLEALACDGVLEQMLKNPDPAVRLWGAKGLGMIAPTLTKVGGSSREDAVKTLKEAEGVENSAVVKGEIERALAAF